MRLLVTRPEPGASRTAEALARLGHDVVKSPLFTFRLLADQPLPNGPFQAVLVTSANAITALAAHPERDLLKEVPLYSVGDATAVQARRAGFVNVHSAGGDAIDLIRLIAESCRPTDGPLLYIAGEDRAAELDDRLAPGGFEVQTVMLYAMDPDGLSDEALEAMRQDTLDGLLAYSPRAAAALALALRAAGLVPLSPDLCCFCLSEAVAAPLRAIAAGPVVVAPAPDQISLFAAIQAAEEVGAGRPRGAGP